MDPEQTFLRAHARLSGILSQLLTPRIRLVLESVYLAITIALFCLLIVMHMNFVQQPGCSSELSGINFTEAQLFQTKITSGKLWAHVSAEQNRVNSLKQENPIKSTKTPGVNGERFTFLSTKLLSHWIGSGAKRSKLIFKYWRSELVEHQVEKVADVTPPPPPPSKSVPDETAVKAGTELQKGDPVTTREAFKAALVCFCSRWNIYVYSYWKLAKKFSASSSQTAKSGGWNVLPDISKLSELLHIEHLNAYLVQWPERRSKAVEPTYLYTSKKGYFLLPEVAKALHNIRTINVTISAENACFGNSHGIVNATTLHIWMQDTCANYRMSTSVENAVFYGPTSYDSRVSNGGGLLTLICWGAFVTFSVVVVVVAMLVRWYKRRCRLAAGEMITEGMELVILPPPGLVRDRMRLRECEECCICFEDFKEGDQVCVLPCRVILHPHCATSYFQRFEGCPVQCTVPPAS